MTLNTFKFYLKRLLLEIMSLHIRERTRSLGKKYKYLINLYRLGYLPKFTTKLETKFNKSYFP